MTGYLLFDNYNRKLIDKKERKLTSSLFSFKEMFPQLINAGFFYKKIQKMPEHLLLENIKITNQNSLFHTCNNYVGFNEQEYVKSIIAVANKLNHEITANNNTLVSLLQTCTEKKRINLDTFSFFYNNIQLPENSFNILPDIPQINPFYEKELGKTFRQNKPPRPLTAFKHFSSKYFFLNLPDYNNIDDIIKTVSMRNYENLSPLSYPFFVHENSLDDLSFQLFKKINKFLSIKIYILSDNIFDPRWKKINIFDINLEKNIEIQDYTICLYEKNQIMAYASENAHNIMDFFNNLKTIKFKKDKTINTTTKKFNHLNILIKKELAKTKIKSNYAKNYTNNPLNQGVLLKEIGNYYFKQEKHSYAKRYYLKSMEALARISEKNEFEKAEFNLAQIELNLCNTDFTTLFFSNELKKAEKNNREIDKAMAFASLGKIFLIQSKFTNAIENTNKAINICKKNNFKDLLQNFYYQLATILMTQNDETNSAKYITILEDNQTDNLFAKEIIFLKCELEILKNNYEKAELILDSLKNLEPHTQIDSVHKKMLQAIIKNKSAQHNMVLFFEADKIPIPYIATELKANILKNCSALAYVLEEKVIEKEMKFVKQFNNSYYKLYKKALMKKRITKLDNTIFDKLNILLDLGVNRHNEGFQEILSSIGEYLGLGNLKLQGGKNTKNATNLVIDNSGKLCIISEKGFDSKLVPFLNFITNLSAAFINSNSITFSKTSNECPFLNSIIGNSNSINDLKKKLQQVANFDFPVLILGASGTGKEMAAKSIHYCSKFKNLPFLAINCAALPENLIESQLFGHKKGSFTGAVSDKKGIFEEAGNGTVFLDEVGELSLSTQAKLLRVLQEKEAFKVGENNSYKIKSRFVFATNKNLQEEVKNKTFREDLYYRIAGIIIQTPSLDERKEDVPVLAEHFLKPYGKTLSPDAESLLMRHKFKGNVRELQNILVSAIVSCQDEEEINGFHLPENLKPELAPIFSGQLKKATGVFQKNYISKVLAENNFNNTKTAEKLGITRQRLIQLKKQYDI